MPSDFCAGRKPENIHRTNLLHFGHHVSVDDIHVGGGHFQQYLYYHLRLLGCEAWNKQILLLLNVYLLSTHIIKYKLSGKRQTNHFLRGAAPPRGCRKTASYHQSWVCLVSGHTGTFWRMYSALKVNGKVTY